MEKSALQHITSGRDWGKHGLNPLLVRLTKFAAWIWITSMYRVEKQGLEHLPKESAFILVPKHQCWLDIPLIGMATPRPLYYMAKYELFINPLSGWFISAVGGIPINRAKPISTRPSLTRMMACISQGSGVVIFPEGTYYPNRIGVARTGLIKMVRSRSNAPFIPVGIRYFKGKGRGVVKIKYGSPLERDPNMAMADFLAMIMRKIALLSEL